MQDFLPSFDHAPLLHSFSLLLIFALFSLLYLCLGKEPWIALAQSRETANGNGWNLAHTEKDFGYLPRKTSLDGSASQIGDQAIPVGRENLSEALPAHEFCEGRDHWNPSATWTGQEERHLVRKTDLYLLHRICVMICWFPASSKRALTRLFQFFDL